MDTQIVSQETKIEAWLHQYGFSYNPFQFTDSERDVNLDEHFVEYPDFDKMLDLRDQILFARTGDGKTATRLRLQTFYRDAVADQRVFAFSYLIPKELADKPPHDWHGHLKPLLTAAVSHLFVFLTLRGLGLPVLRHDETAVSLAHRLAYYFHEYYALPGTWQEDLEQAIIDRSMRQSITSLEPVFDDLESLARLGTLNTVWARRWLELLTTRGIPSEAHLPVQTLDRWFDFCELLQMIGLQKIVILVDGVDTKPTHAPSARQRQVHSSIENEKMASVVRMKAVVEPLLDLMQTKKLGNSVAWKIFLPSELYLPVIPLLPNGFPHAILWWDYVRLRQLLKFRLSAASQGRITTLLQISDNDIPQDLETYLVIQANSSPRYLIHYINKLFGVHVDQSDKSPLPGKFSGKALATIEYLSHPSP